MCLKLPAGCALPHFACRAPQACDWRAFGPMELEGIVSKCVTSRYKSGSCLAWVKVKNPAYERRSGV